jgi:hypothetical protein
VRGSGRKVGWGSWAAAASGAAFAVVVACSSSSSPPTTHQAVQGICPTTPDETIGVACAVPGLTCGPEYMCGVATVTLFCVCTSGTFQCTDGQGSPVVAGAALACPGTPTTSACPANERVAQLAACTEQGLLCSYASSCPSMVDQCQCSPGTTATGTFGLRFECHPANCVDGGPVVDASPRDATGAEAATDATSTADTGSDAHDATSDAPSTVDANGDVTFPVDDGSIADGAPGDAFSE